MTAANVENPITKAMQELRRFPRAQWLDLARSDQSLRWRKGMGIDAESYFVQLPEIRTDLEEALREHGLDGLTEIGKARKMLLEPSGKISVIKAS